MSVSEVVVVVVSATTTIRKLLEERIQKRGTEFNLMQTVQLTDCMSATWPQPMCTVKNSVADIWSVRPVWQQLGLRCFCNNRISQSCGNHNRAAQSD